jgi:hypothetical protein
VLPAAPLLGNWVSRLRVVEVGRDDKLQQLRKLPDDMLWGTVLLVPPQPIVCLDDLSQLVSQIVLTTASGHNLRQAVPTDRFRHMIMWCGAAFSHVSAADCLP